MNAPRDAILRHARLHFARYGYGGSLQDLATAARKSKAAICYHFPAKTDLVVGLVEVLLEEVGPWQTFDLAHLVRQHLVWLADENARLLLALRAAALVEAPLRRPIERLRDVIVAAYRRHVSSQIEAVMFVGAVEAAVVYPPQDVLEALRSAATRRMSGGGME